MNILRAIVSNFMRGAREQYHKDARLWASVRTTFKWIGMGMPPCTVCGALDYKVVTYPRFTTDRFSRERVTVQVRCNACKVEATARKSPDAHGWSFKMQG